MRAENGTPIAGAAVVISRARLRRAGSLDGNYSHEDCLKHARTDEHGAFSIPEVESDRTFELVVAAPDYGTRLVSAIEAGDRPQVVVLSAPRLKTVDRRTNNVVGLVVDPEGDPIGGAIVVPRGYMQGNIGLEGPMDEIADTTVTDRDGKFQVPSTMAVSALHLEISARGFVPQFFDSVENGGHEQTLAVKRGATLRGRIVLDGQPRRGIVVGVNVTPRLSGSWNGPWGAETDRDGRFSIAHVVAGKEVCVFATMESVGELGAAPQFYVTPVEENTINLGDMPISAGRRLHGRVALADNAALPKNLHVNVLREGSGDRMLTPVDGDGKFDARNLPDEILSVNAYSLIEGSERRTWPWPFHLSDKNGSLDPHNPQRLLGRLCEDTEITILLAPGKFEFPPPPSTPEESSRLQAAVERLRGSALKGFDASGP